MVRFEWQLGDWIVEFLSNCAGSDEEKIFKHFEIEKQDAIANYLFVL